MSSFAEVLLCRGELNNWTTVGARLPVRSGVFSFFFSRRAGFLVFSSVSRGGNFGLPVPGTRPNHSSYGTGTSKVVGEGKKITLSSQVGVKKCRCGPLYGSLRAVKFGNKRRIVMWLRSVLE